MLEKNKKAVYELKNKQEKVELLRDQFNEEGYLVLKDFFNNDDDDSVQTLPPGRTVQKLAP